MSRIAAYGGAAMGILQRDALVFASYRIAFLSQLATTLMSLVLFYYISRLVTVGEFSSSDAYFAFALIGLLALDVLSSAAILVPTSMRQELVAGTFERLLLSPFGAVLSIASMMLFPFALAIVKGVIAVAVATLVFGLPLQWPEAILAVPVIALGALSFAPFGVIVAATVLITKQALGLSNWIVAGLSIVAGFYFPVALLPNWMEWISEVQPFTPALELMRNVLVGTEMTQSAWLATLKLVGFAVVLAPLSMLFLSKAIKVSRRRGTIIEY